MRLPSCVGLLCLAIPVIGAPAAAAQELIGKRFFPDQLVLSEPFVEDELSLPSVLHIRRPSTGGEPHRAVTELGAELKKRLTSGLEASVAGGVDVLGSDRASGGSGFENLAVGLKYQFFRNDAHEAVASVAVDWDVGGTGARRIGAPSFDTVTAMLLAGKGLGELREPGLRPLAVTALLGAEFPTVRTEQHPDVARWGIAVQYSLVYLRSVVGDVAVPPVLRQLIPLVEVDLQTPLDRAAAGKTTGTVNPGAIWVSEAVEIGVEAVLPVNDRTGKNIGVRAFLRFSLDTVLGQWAAHPLFGPPD